jgi:hypothetical protein
MATEEDIIMSWGKNLRIPAQYEEYSVCRFTIVSMVRSKWWWWRL